MDAIETEMHFLLIYPNYTNLRRQFLTPYFCRLLTVQKFNLYTLLYPYSSFVFDVKLCTFH